MSSLSLTASVRYLLPGAERPIYHASEGGADAQMNIGAQFEDRDVEIVDARTLARPPSLDREGFALKVHESPVDDYYALEHQRELYEARITQLVCELTGAAEARVFDHTLRSDSPAVRGEHATREPASVIHNDYTDASAVKRLRDFLGASDAEKRLRHRFAIINVWRSVAGPVLRSPMTCCDARTLSPADFVATERRAKERTGELELVRFNPAHRWYYYPEMTAREVLLLKTFDSAQDGRATRTVHTAFENPLAPFDAPPRESIESRLLVFFDEA